MTQRRATLASLWVSGLPCYRLGYAPSTRSHLGVRGLSVVPSLLSGLPDPVSPQTASYTRLRSTTSWAQSPLSCVTWDLTTR